MTFPYRRYTVRDPGGRERFLYRPDIEIRVTHGVRAVAVYGLLDTGADMVLFPAAVAGVLGVARDRTRTGRVRGFGSGPSEVEFATVTLQVGSGRGTLSWPARVGLLAAWPEEQDVVILGRTGFLGYFDVLFRERAREVVLTPNRSFPRAGDRRLAQRYP